MERATLEILSQLGFQGENGFSWLLTSAAFDPTGERKRKIARVPARFMRMRVKFLPRNPALFGGRSAPRLPRIVPASYVAHSTPLLVGVLKQAHCLVCRKVIVVSQYRM